MNFLDLNDDVKSIISKHLQSDYKIDKTCMTKPDDNFKKKLFGEVKEMNIDIIDICIDLKKKLMMKLNFLNKIIRKFIWANIIMILGKN